MLTVFLPDRHYCERGYNTAMVETISDRIQMRLKELGLSERQAALGAGMSADGIRNMRRNPTITLTRYSSSTTSRERRFPPKQQRALIGAAMSGARYGWNATRSGSCFEIGAFSPEKSESLGTPVTKCGTPRARILRKTDPVGAGQ